ncbi:TPA: hypothetical protein DD712_04495 [Candidatus Acetothermia bacterium]|nr:hypothetical protein [Candidatus Acetothermia bacterium]
MAIPMSARRRAASCYHLRYDANVLSQTTSRRAGMAHASVGLSGKGWRRLTGSPQATESMTVKWFKEQKLVSLTKRYVALQQ